MQRRAGGLVGDNPIGCPKIALKPLPVETRSATLGPVSTVPPIPFVTTVRGITPEILLNGIRAARLEPCLLSSGPALSQLGRLVCPNVCLDLAAVGPAMQVTGETSPAYYTLVYVVACPGKGRAFNFSMEHTDGYLGFFVPGGVIDATMPEGYANATLTIPVAEFHAARQRLFPELPDEILRKGAGLRVGVAEQARLRALVARIEEVLWQSPETFSSAEIRQQLEEELLVAFFDALRSGCTQLLRPLNLRSGGRIRQLQLARDFLAAHAHEPVYLDDLCTTLGLSERAVENLFRDLLGITPITYLRHQRLHRARRTLLKAPASPALVKQVALECGFWHLGRFARDYRTLFAESPSQTLAQRL